MSLPIRFESPFDSDLRPIGQMISSPLHVHLFHLLLLNVIDSTPLVHFPSEDAGY